MEERRKDKRTNRSSSIILTRLDDGKDAEVDIEILDASKAGIGFTCKEKLSIGSIYGANLTIWTREVLHTFLEIVRAEENDDVMSYGATFVGMTKTDACKIETYQTIEDYR